jgi:hypothetical protein
MAFVELGSSMACAAVLRLPVTMAFEKSIQQQPDSPEPFCSRENRSLRTPNVSGHAAKPVLSLNEGVELAEIIAEET